MRLAAWVCTKGVLIGTPEVRGAVGANVRASSLRRERPSTVESVSRTGGCPPNALAVQVESLAQLGERLAALPVLRADSPCGMVWLKLRDSPTTAQPRPVAVHLSVFTEKLMFEALQDGLTGAFKTLRGKGKLSEANMRDGLKLVEKSLLEADVSFAVVRDFMARVTEEAVGEKVLKSLDPSQQVVGIVYQELVDLMGPVDHSLHLKGKGEVTVLMMCGLQGSGKTTTCGKLGRMLKEAGRKPLLVAADLQRPAAIDQLHVLGEQLGIAVYSDRAQKDPVDGLPAPRSSRPRSSAPTS